MPAVPTGSGPLGDTFFTTRWSVVAAAGRGLAGQPPPADARAALQELCSAYWPPLYAYARRAGAAPGDAADQVQDFFARLLEKGDLAAADPARGRFRAWLLAAFRHHAANLRDRERAAKRGGGRRALPLPGGLALDADKAESRYAPEPSHARTPEREFERRWALQVLERALERLAAEQARAGRAQAFARLRPYLSPGGDEAPYAQVAAELGRSEGALKVAVHRLRRRYGELLRAEVAGTLDDPREVQAELAALMEALGG